MSISWDYLNDFKAEIIKNKRSKTADAYLSDLKKFREYFRLNFEEITEESIDNYKKFLADSKVKAKTINRKLISIRQFMQFLNKKGLQHRFDIEVKLMKIQKQEFLNEILTFNDFERLVRAAEEAGDKRAIAIFYCLYYTGLRVSEMLSLSVADINEDSAEVNGKGDKYRTVFLNDKLRKYLKDYIRERNHSEDAKLFLNKNKDTVMDRQSVHNVIKYYAGKSKIKKSKAHAHNFRHLFAFRLLDAGVSIDQLADLLGHTDINTTRIYTRKTKKELFESINRL